MNHFTIPFLSLAVLSSSVFAQETSGENSNTDSLKMDVTFVGEREMVVKDALKLQSWPELRKLENGKREFSYRLLAKRMNVSPVWSMIEPVRLRVDAPLSRLYRGYARAGYGLNNTPLIDISYTDLRSREGTWGIHGSHFATNAPLGIVDDRFKNSNGGVWISRFVGKERIDFSADVSRKNIVFYGNAQSDTLPPINELGTHERYLTLGADLAFKSHHRDSTDLNHEIDLKWTSFKDLQSTVENNYEGSFKAGKFVNKEHYSLSGYMNIDRLVIGTNNPDTARTDAAIASITPMVTSYRGPLTVRVGAGLWIDADAQSRNGNGSTFHFYPKIEASLRVLRDVFVPYISLDGGLDQNRLETVVRDNPFYFSDMGSEFRTTSISRELEVGMRGTITEAISFQAYGSTAHYEDYMYFVNDTLLDVGTRFSSFYDTLTITKIGGHITLDLIDNLGLRLAGTLFKYDANGLENAWNLPSAKWSVEASYGFLDKFTVDCSMEIISSRAGLTQIQRNPEDEPILQNGEVNSYKVELPSYIDANIGIEYRYNSRTAVWLRCSNVTNSNYSKWVGYPVQGFQALFGASYAF
jgi:hypothetical protein